jgi:microcystin-dependent protein
VADPFIGEIRLFAGNFAPKDWEFCHGQLVNIASNTALFAILGTTYGGNGISTFGLPDLRGRVPVGTAQGPGLSQYDLGQVGGVEQVAPLTTQLPVHTHSLSNASFAIAAYSGAGNSRNPAGAVFAKEAAGVTQTYSSASADATMAANVLKPGQLGAAGGGQPVGLLQPYLTLNYIICVIGVFPSRN